MRPDVKSEVEAQRDYYRRTAASYDHCHVESKGEHDFAAAFLLSMVTHLEIRSVIDLGSGTGRVLLKTKESFPQLKILGVEPAENLRNIGYSKGLSPDELVDGDAQQLSYADGSFDLVCEFGALHHIPEPSKAVSEMLRVSAKAIFISDSNNFGQGSLAGRSLKQALRALGLWQMANFVKTRGKGYSVSEGDGLSYSYSVFSNYAGRCRGSDRRVHLLNSTSAGINLYRSASHIALLA